jgi:hypothetical protein
MITSTPISVAYSPISEQKITPPMEETDEFILYGPVPSPYMDEG